MLKLPLTAFVPLQPPEAVQEVALLEVHVNVEPAPLVTLVGLALIETLGGVAETVTVADCLARAARSGAGQRVLRGRGQGCGRH